MSELQEYKCPNCGGALKFESGTDTLKCPYCGSKVNVEAFAEPDLGTKEDNFKWEDIASAQWEEGETDKMKVYVCDSCGGEIIADESTVASKCPYCDNPVVMKGNLQGDLKPDYVIPFKIDKKQAMASYYKHLQGKKFLPKIFKDQNHIDEMKAIYVPFWLFDCDADASISYDATRIRTWSDSKRDYTETSHYRIYREGELGFDNIPVDGSLAMPDDLTQSVEPYNFDEAVEFKTAYLAGYLADKYTVGVNDSIEIANNRVKQSVEDAFRATVEGYSTVITTSNFVNVKKGKSKYALYPIWVLNTTFQGKNYIFGINGQTGKIAGNLPMDKGAYWRYVIAATGIAGALVLGIEYLMFLL